MKNNYKYAYIGFLAAFLTTIAFLPQVIKIIRSSNTSGVSLKMFILTSLGLFFWIIYSISNRDYAILLASSIQLILNLIIIFYISLDRMKINKKK